MMETLVHVLITFVPLSVLAHSIWSHGKTLKTLKRAVNLCCHLSDDVDGLSSDLDSAIEVMRRRVRGEATVESMGEWLDLNYPEKGDE
jgi:hypothetical protein